MNRHSSPDREALIQALTVSATNNPSKPALAEWAELAVDIDNFRTRPSWHRAPPGLRFLAVDTASACNLTCPRMCYYHPTATVQRPRAEIERFTLAVVQAATDLGLGTLAFAGKEPLVDTPRLAALAEAANAIPNRTFSIGLVTNGTLVERNWDTLDRLVRDGVIDFIDVSIDSPHAAQHDEIRGLAGAHAAAHKALARMLAEWPELRIGTTSVLRNDNVGAIADLVELADPRLRHFFVFPFQPPIFEESDPPPDWTTINECMDAVEAVLAGARRGDGIDVSVSLLGLHVADAVASGKISLDALEEDENGQIYFRRAVGGNTLTIFLQVLPETGRHGLRILSDGTVLPGTHYLQAPRPERFAVGNIIGESILDIHQRAGAADSAIDRLWATRPDHACRDRPCWPVCFGGIAVSDNNILTGKPLVLPPELCISSGAESANATLGRPTR